MGERRVASALRTRASDHEPAAGRQEPGDPPAERERDQQGQGRNREPEDDFSDSWRTYREHADHIRQTYGWRVPEPPPRATHWLQLGRKDDQEYGEPPDQWRRWSGEDRDARHDER